MLLGILREQLSIDREVLDRVPYLLKRFWPLYDSISSYFRLEGY